MTKIILFGALGHMGQEVVKQIQTSTSFEIVAGVDTKKDEQNNLPFPIFQNANDIKEKADAIVDFSFHGAVKDILEFAKNNNLPTVLCTTGYTDEELKLIEKVSKIIPIFLSANMSVGVNLVSMLSQIATAVLEGYDIEIVEKHHNRKLDAPSGTALMLANSIKAVRKELYPVFDRSTLHQPRNKNEMGISSIRGGNITGEHEVLFIGDEETIEIKHSASSRAIFAKGALDAVKFVVGKEARMYSMNDIMTNSKFLKN